MSEPLAKRRRVSRTVRLGDAFPDVLAFLSRWDLDVVQVAARVFRNVVSNSLRKVCLRQLNHSHWRYMDVADLPYEVEVRSIVNQVRALHVEGSFEETAAFFSNAIRSATFDAQLYIDVERPLPPFLLNDVFPTVDVQEKVAISFSYGSVFQAISDATAAVSALNKVSALTLDGQGMRLFLNDAVFMELKTAGIRHLRIEERGEAAFDSVAISANAIIQFLGGSEDCTLDLDPISVDKDVVKDVLAACEDGSLAQNFRLDFGLTDITREYITSVECIEVEEHGEYLLGDNPLTVPKHHLEFVCNGDYVQVYRGTYSDSRFDSRVL